MRTMRTLITLNMHYIPFNVHYLQSSWTLTTGTLYTHFTLYILFTTLLLTAHMYILHLFIDRLYTLCSPIHSVSFISLLLFL